MLNLWLDLVSVGLLNQNDLWVLDLRQVLVLLLAVFVCDREHTDWAILRAREQSLVIVADPHLFNGQWVSLNFKVFLKRILQHLNTTRLVLLLGTTTNTSKDGATVVHDNDLLQARLLFEPHHFFTHVVVTFLEFSQASQGVSCIDERLLLALRFISS